MASGLPLPTLLSQALVAFTIEFDNEAEHQMDHRTSTGGGAAPGAPWLVSQVMWANVMQFVGADGITADELHDRAHTTRDSLAGLQRWGYVVVEPAGGRIRPTAAGRRAQAVWRPLATLVEERWEERFGTDHLRRLRGALIAIVGRLDLELPAYLPIVYPTQNGKAEVPPPRSGAGVPADLDLSALLSQVLLAFTIDFEASSRISLAISANTLRVLDGAGVRVRDLPTRTGVSKEANAMASGWLARHGCVVIEPDPAATRGQVVRLTEKGQRAQAKYRRVLAATEQQWRARFGGDTVDDLRGQLDAVIGGPLAAGLEPYPDGWRASVRRPTTLPHYPMVLHRGGYPDGS